MNTSLYGISELTLRTAAPIKLRADASLKGVLRSLDAFLTRYIIELHPMLDSEHDLGESVPLSNQEDQISLDTDGCLTLRLRFFAPAGDQFHAVEQALLGVIHGHGALEVINHGAPLDVAIRPIFLGASKAAQSAARIEYALGKASTWLKPEEMSAVSAKSLATMVLNAEKALALDALLAELTAAGFNQPDKPMNGGDCFDMISSLYQRLVKRFPR